LKNIAFSIVIYLVSNLGMTSESSNINWVQMSSANDITIFEGDILESGVIPLKGNLIINSPIEKVAAILDNSSLKPSWLPAIEDLNVLNQKSPYKKVEFYKVEMPFIISNRTFIMESKASVNNVKSINDKVVFDSSSVRGNVQNSYIRISKISDMQTQIEGVFYTDPRGFVPNWVVTRFTRQFCRESLSKLKVLTEKKNISKSTLKRYADLINNYAEVNKVVVSN
jgi:hypothetical protein